VSAWFLVAYHFLFFWKFYKNPYLLCTSEMASTFFPHWLWMGKMLRRGIFPAVDAIYFKLPGSIPFLATFNPPSLLTAYLGSFLNQDNAFRLYVYSILAHYILGSFFAYLLFGNLFATITLIYAGYCIKLQQPTIAYTLAWIPAMFLKGWLGVLGCGMALVSGYYPILVYVMPVVAIVNPLALLGTLIALPQLIPFVGYFKRSVRVGQKVDRNFGRLPWWRLTDLFILSRTQNHVNGVHYPEVAMYMGIAPLFIFSLLFHQVPFPSFWYLVLASSICLAIGILPSIQRIPARALYLLTLSISILSSASIELLYTVALKYLTFLQCFLLLRNSSLYPSFPFSQWWDKPSRLYTKKPKMNNWPYITGYLEGRSVSEYRGAFALK